MKILVACEYSGVVRDAFRKLGHDAWSCDIIQTDSDPTYHYQCDIKDVLYDNWDMVIAHPPCTHLASSGARHFEQKRIDGRQQQGIDFFMMFTELKCEKVAIENPVGIMSKVFKKPDQIIQPWMFGNPFQKSTCLWLKGLPLLKPTNIVDKGEFYISPTGRKMPKWYADNKNAKVRSKTFQGIADAMAAQWGAIQEQIKTA